MLLLTSLLFSGGATAGDYGHFDHDDYGDPKADLRNSSLLGVTFSESMPAVTQTQLAGNSLSEYPFFEYVKAFNEDTTVELGIDPTRFPEIVGLTGDIYVIEAKGADAWHIDQPLIDVTPDGPLTVTFGGTTIQENTFVVAGPYDLESAAFVSATNDFTGLGHGYDMVIDMNRNAELDEGDYVDGYDQEAGLYIIHDTSQRGPLEVTEEGPYSVGKIFGIPPNLTNEILYFPTNIAEMDPLPLIVIGHGSGHSYLWYDHIGYHMASYGYIVMSHQNHPVSTVLGHTDAILELQDVIAGGVLDGKIDSNRIVWIGHSFGAISAVTSYDRLVNGGYLPTHYTEDSIVLISSMLPPAGTGLDGAQHPYTLDFLGDETFTLTLRDSASVSSSINIGAYGGGLEQPYQRRGGWHNEMERIRITLNDYLTNGSGLDLSSIEAVRIDVGPYWGSNKGRIVIDELMLTND